MYLNEIDTVTICSLTHESITSNVSVLPFIVYNVLRPNFDRSCHVLYFQQGTVKPAPSFDVDKDCEALRNAMKGAGKWSVFFLLAV